jgi:PAS domain S-box-containing protein
MAGGVATRQAALHEVVVGSALDAIIIMNAAGVVVEFNPAAERMFGYSRAEAANRPLAELIIPPELRERHASGLRRYLATGKPSILGQRLALRALRKGGEEFPVELTIAVLPVEGGPPMFTGYVRDVSEREREAALASGQGRVLEMIAAGAEFSNTLDELVRAVEQDSPEVLASILLLDDDGAHLRHGAAPSLPAGYSKAIDGALIGESAGSCGTAAYRRAQVIVEDIDTDPLWADYRDLAAAHGLRACWSTPIFDPQRRVLGTFALYFRAPRRPDPRHVRLIEMATQTAAIAIASMKSERERAGLMDALQTSESMFRSIFENAAIGVTIADMQRRLKRYNPAFAHMLGYSDTELVGRNFADLTHPDDVAPNAAVWQRLAAGTSIISRSTSATCTRTAAQFGHTSRCR